MKEARPSRGIEGRAENDEVKAMVLLIAEKVNAEKARTFGLECVRRRVQQAQYQGKETRLNIKKTKKRRERREASGRHSRGFCFQGDRCLWTSSDCVRKFGREG